MRRKHPPKPTLIPENTVLKLLMLRLARIGSIIFRQNVGQAWTGSKVLPQSSPPGSVLLLDARPVQMGLTKGSYDLIGWTRKTITADMVDKDVAVFTAVEAKNSHGGKTSPEQVTFGKNVRKDGGIAGVASSEEQAQEIIDRWDPQ